MMELLIFLLPLFCCLIKNLSIVIKDFIFVAVNLIDENSRSINFSIEKIRNLNKTNSKSSTNIIFQILFFKYFNRNKQTEKVNKVKENENYCDLHKDSVNKKIKKTFIIFLTKIYSQNFSHILFSLIILMEIFKKKIQQLITEIKKEQQRHQQQPQEEIVKFFIDILQQKIEKEVEENFKEIDVKEDVEKIETFRQLLVRQVKQEEILQSETRIDDDDRCHFSDANTVKLKN